MKFITVRVPENFKEHIVENLSNEYNEKSDMEQWLDQNTKILSKEVPFASFKVPGLPVYPMIPSISVGQMNRDIVANYLKQKERESKEVESKEVKKDLSQLIVTLMNGADHTHDKVSDWDINTEGQVWVYGADNEVSAVYADRTWKFVMVA